MKCSRCGHISRSLPAMGRHVRKAHPSAMKRAPRQGASPSGKKHRRRGDQGNDTADCSCYTCVAIRHLRSQGVL